MSGPDWDLLSSYAGLLTLACSSIYFGSFGSLPNPKRQDGSPADEDDEEEVPDRMSAGDAWLFPVLGSVALLGLYTIVKFFGKEWINWFLGWYFSIAGVMSVWKSSISFIRFLLGPTRWKQFEKTSILIKKGSTSLLSLSWRTPSLFLFPLAIVPSAIYSFSTASRKPVLMTNILSLSFSHNALSLLKIDSSQTGAILLSGLFFYDIWWVFGTEVMVKVATTLDVPIKLLWPKSLIFSDVGGFTMLGLGDVVIPGTFIAFALRFDHHRALQSNASPQGSFPKPYFYSVLTSYFLGLVATMSVMHVFGKAQPALLYLSPACILSFFLTAFVRGEFREACRWSDDPDSTRTATAVEKKSN
ncbi:peptidase A22B, signal peptide peptidase [Lyophyllum atratum]|nr:peptidase A22B, signal peptide peptidase [Lyophyllum atratum]